MTKACQLPFWGMPKVAVRASPPAVTLPTSAPLASAGNAGANIDTGTSVTTWYTSW